MSPLVETKTVSLSLLVATRVMHILNSSVLPHSAGIYLSRARVATSGDNPNTGSVHHGL